MEKENLRKREEAVKSAAAVSADVTVTAASPKSSNDARGQLESEPSEFLVNEKISMVHSATIPSKTFSLGTAKGVEGVECQSLGEAQMDIPRPSIEVCKSA